MIELVGCEMITEGNPRITASQSTQICQSYLLKFAPDYLGKEVRPTKIMLSFNLFTKVHNQKLDSIRGGYND